ncbi:MAG: FAD-dependent oxidoreductase [Dehalococcoidia bacterium]|nr:MAG: FAD-dependent oxidoreductase [Dehalococcoidia bacterium]
MPRQDEERPPDGPRHAVFATARADGRPFFILPWHGCTLVGTTDLRYDGDPSAARCTREELRYLLDEANRLFPRAPLTVEQVLYTYSGIRPLPYSERGDESTISRSHFIIDHVKRGGPSGLLSIVGGKLTTYRSLARLAMPAIARHAGPSGRGLRAGAKMEGGGSKVEWRAPQHDALSVYGPKRGEVEAMIEGAPALGERVCEHNGELLAQVAYAVECEQAVTLGDVLLRRIPAGWSRCHALDGAERVARIMAQRLGWDEARVACEVQAYERELRETLVPVDELER